MRLGLIARSDNSGLGIQTLEFYRHMKPAKTMVVDISKHNNNRIFNERYSDNPIGIVTFITGFPQTIDINDFLQDLDVVFIAESAYNPYLFIRAHEMGVKTAVQYNYEFFDWFNPNNPRPDMLIAPSQWHYNDVQRFCDEFNIKHIYLHCPVNRQLLPPRAIQHPPTFLHLAGKSAAHDRNGTETVIRASRELLTEAKIVVHFQGEQGLPHQATHNIEYYEKLLQKHGDPAKLTIVKREIAEYQHLYAMGDVLVLPRRYGGNCLPLNEALSVGMPVIMTDLQPNNNLLPDNWLIPAEKIGEFTPRTLVDIYGADPMRLAQKIDEFYLMEPDELATENHIATELGTKISWEIMKPQYEEALCTLL